MKWDAWSRPRASECDYQRGGYVNLARSEVQFERAKASIEHLRSYGFTDDEYRLLGPDEARAECGASKVVGGTFTPFCAAIHPARLARGLGRSVERLGATIYEHSPVVELAPNRVRTQLGTVTAGVVVRATEAFTATLPGHARELVPIYSLMVATEPLPAAFWNEVGLHDRATFNDGRHMIIYGQRTADGRLAFGGRGAPYHFGSKVRPEYDRNDTVKGLLHETLRELFPSLGDAAITHQWGGAVAAARDWWCSASFDPATGHGDGRRIRGRRSGNHQPVGPHAGRPHHARAVRAHLAAVGRSPLEAVGAGAVALDRHQRDGAPAHRGRRARGEEGHPAEGT